MLLALSLLLPLAVATTKTLPCLSAGNPDSFYSKPLSERPNLERILQHGHMFSQIQATLPSTSLPGNSVQVHQAFVNRPFRKLDASNCHPVLVSTPNEFIRCVRSSEAAIESTNSRSFASLLTQQILLEVTLQSSFSYPQSSPFYNPSYEQWKGEVTSFLDTLFQCTEWGYIERFLTEYSCSVATFCQELEPDFLRDLASLPLSSTEPLEPYQDFVDKWGYGTVEGFRLGAASLELRSSTPDTDDDAVLYMGRAGGAGIQHVLEGNLSASLYTDDDCEDPEPIRLLYQSWDDFLDDTVYFNFILNGTFQNRTQVQENFSRFYRDSFSGLTSQVSDQSDLTSQVCPTNGPTKAPVSRKPSVSPSNQQTSLSPTLTPGAQSTSFPSATPSTSNPISAATMICQSVVAYTMLITTYVVMLG